MFSLKVCARSGRLSGHPLPKTWIVREPPFKKIEVGRHSILPIRIDALIIAIRLRADLNCSRNRSDNTSTSDTEPDAIISPKNNETCRKIQSPAISPRDDDDRAPFGKRKINSNSTTHSTEVRIKECRTFRMSIKQLYRIFQQNPILVANCERP